MSKIVLLNSTVVGTHTHYAGNVVDTVLQADEIRLHRSGEVPDSASTRCPRWMEWLLGRDAEGIGTIVIARPTTTIGER